MRSSRSSKAACTCGSSLSMFSRSVFSWATWALAASASSFLPCPISTPICLDRLLRCACNSSLRIWSCLRRPSSSPKRSVSSTKPRCARRWAVVWMSLRSNWMSSMVRVLIKMKMGNNGYCKRKRAQVGKSSLQSVGIPCINRQPAPLLRFEFGCRLLFHSQSGRAAGSICQRSG